MPQCPIECRRVTRTNAQSVARSTQARAAAACAIDLRGGRTQQARHGGGGLEAKSMQRGTLRHDIPSELLCDLATRAKSMQRDTLRHDIPGELLSDLATRQKVHAACTMSVQLSVRVTLFAPCHSLGALPARAPRLATPPNTARYVTRAHEKKSAAATALRRRETSATIPT